MPIRLLNGALLIAAGIGLVLTYRASEKHRHLLAEQTRLEKKVGRLPIRDPSKVHVRALDTGEELHFVWRIYVPAGMNIRWHYGGGGSSGSWSSSADDFIARVRFREDSHGTWNVFTKFAGGSSRSGLGNRELTDLLRDRWDDVQVEQLGSREVAVVETDGIATLLRLTLPDELKREANQKLSGSLAERFQKALFEIRFGSEKAFQQAEASEQAVGD